MPTPISSLPRYMRYRIRRYREGKCINCGKKRDGKYKSFCEACAGHRRRLEKKRRKEKFHQWKPGGRGRPPKNAHEITSRTEAKKLSKKQMVLPSETPVNPE